MRIRRALLIALICGAMLSMGNVAAPYYACENKAEGDACNWGYGCASGGHCVIQEQCTDDPNTTINECLVCDTSR